jgi:hypothetical protein
MWDTTALDLHILESAIGITSTYSISQLTIAINRPVWHSHSVLIAQRQHDEALHPIRRAGHAGHTAWLPMREEWPLDFGRIASIRLVSPVPGLPG